MYNNQKATHKSEIPTLTSTMPPPAAHYSSNSSVATIGANEDMFLQAFDDTPKLNNTTPRKLENELMKTIETISNQSADWDDRVKAIKHFRSLMNSALATSDDFVVSTLKTLEIPFQNNIRDLRSQVVRETCITVAFLSCRLQQKFSRMAEVLLSSLIKLIPTSVKIISSSALVALRFIIQSTHSSRLLPIIRYQLTNSKSKEIRRALCELSERIVTLWSPIIIERCINDLVEVIRLGLSDSDDQARQYARRAFNIFSEHFKQQAEKLYKTLDSQKQRMLSLNRNGGSTLSVNGTSSTSIPSSISSSTNQSSNNPSNIPCSVVNSRNNSVHSPSISASSMLNRLKNTFPANNNRSPAARSTSAIDVAAQRRAKARALHLSPAYRARQFQQASTISGDQTSKAFSQSTYQSHLSNQAQVQNHVNRIAQARNIQTNPSSLLPNFNSLNITDRARPQNKQPSQSYNHLTRRTPSQSSCTSPDQVDSTNKQQLSSKTALSKAAAYLNSLIDDPKQASIHENQIVTATKYFHSIIDKSQTESVKSEASEIMRPLVALAKHESVFVRKVATCALVAVHFKIGISSMEPYLAELPVTPRKMLDLYIKKSGAVNTEPDNVLTVDKY